MPPQSAFLKDALPEVLVVQGRYEKSEHQSGSGSSSLLADHMLEDAAAVRLLPDAALRDDKCTETRHLPPIGNACCKSSRPYFHFDSQ